MGPENNNNIYYRTEDGKEIKTIENLEDYLFYKIPVHKKRKTLIKYLMSLGFSRNTAVEEAEWMKLGRKMRFSHPCLTLNIIDEWDKIK